MDGQGQETGTQQGGFGKTEAFGRSADIPGNVRRSRALREIGARGCSEAAADRNVRAPASSYGRDVLGAFMNQHGLHIFIFSSWSCAGGLASIRGFLIPIAFREIQPHANQD